MFCSFVVMTVLTVITGVGVAAYGVVTALSPRVTPPLDQEVVKEIVRSGDGKCSVTARSTKDSVYLHVATDKKSLNLSCVTGAGPRLTLVRNGEVVLAVELDEGGDAVVTARDRTGAVHGLTPVPECCQAREGK